MLSQGIQHEVRSPLVQLCIFTQTIGHFTQFFPHTSHVRVSNESCQGT